MVSEDVVSKWTCCCVFVVGLAVFVSGGDSSVSLSVLFQPTSADRCTVHTRRPCFCDTLVDVMLWLWTDGAAKKFNVLTVFVSGGDSSVSLNVTFRPTSADRCTADIYISIRHNMYEDSMVQLIGEGYVETITIDDISCTDHFNPPLMLPPPQAAADAVALGAGAEEEDEDMPG